jgi:hypothetical protein
MKKETVEVATPQTFHQQHNNIYSAMINVMNDVKNIDKSMTVGEGKNSYKGVSDKDVKYALGQSMARHGLVCFPVSIEPKVRVDRWEGTDYRGNAAMKQQIFVEVLATFRMVYCATAESIDITGYGHGVDTQDKAAGKATTYALKNALLYSFLVPTGVIDDTDKEHSDAIQVPVAKVKQPAADELVDKFITSVQGGTAKWTIEKFMSTYELTESQQNKLNAL